MKIIDKLFGTYSEREIKKINKQIERIEELAEAYAAKSDIELYGTTEALRARLSSGETLEDLLPDAFAAVREAATRALEKRPFRVQLIGGILLHQGRIAEMKTGEGKTLVATLPAYLNALEGKGVHIVTVNDYLARCGADEMGRVYAALGMTTGLILQGQYPDEKRKAYACDVTYGTNNELGFDYLRDNREVYKKNKVQRSLHFAIVDEVDSILIDEARTPLIISGRGGEPSDLYVKAESFVRSLKKLVVAELDDKESHDDIKEDYIVDEKARTSTLTKNGIAKAEKFFGLENLSDGDNIEIVHHISQALKAHGIMKKDVDYIVKNDQVLIVDSFTGRIMLGRRFSDGLHQAIEAKENVKVNEENRTLATITFQNYFRLYKKLSGMTGTARTEEMEFREIYSLDVVEVPTNKPMIRVDHPDAVYMTLNAKRHAIIDQIKECYNKGQPVLVGTVSIDKSEELSRMLQMERIPHNVLNAKHHEREAEIVAQAGRYGAVTIATNMAGRGTDIMLGGNAEFMAKAEMRRLGHDEAMIAAAMGFFPTDNEEILSARKEFAELKKQFSEKIRPEAEKVCSLGGLFILGTERHESRRIDNQLRGRSGRQGDPGESRFYISMEDDIARLFGGERMKSIISGINQDESLALESKMLSSSLESAQKRIEERNFQSRKHVLSFDDVMNQQRLVIYKQRDMVLDDEDISERITTMIKEVVAGDVLAATAGGEDRSLWNTEDIKRKFEPLFPRDASPFTPEKLESVSPTELEEIILDRAMKVYKDKEIIFGGEKYAREMERVLLLHFVDEKWIDHLEAMEDLKLGISLNSYAQRNPITEYRITGADMFDEMIADIRESTVRAVLYARPVPNKAVAVRKQVGEQINEGFAGGKPPVRKAAQEKVGRNDPCPCGSGKKYKHCCGANKG